MLAFMERYGHQQISELKKLTLSELRDHHEAVEELVREERESFANDMFEPD